jgi:hypothetical protein
MPLNPVIEPGCEWTSPDNRGVCVGCGGVEGGYAKRDPMGHWRAFCWACVKPVNAGAAQPKREMVGTVYTDIDAEEIEKPKKKNPGMAPSKNRPKVN